MRTHRVTQKSRSATSGFLPLSGEIPWNFVGSQKQFLTLGNSQNFKCLSRFFQKLQELCLQKPSISFICDRFVHFSFSIFINYFYILFFSLASQSCTDTFLFYCSLWFVIFWYAEGGVNTLKCLRNKFNFNNSVAQLYLLMVICVKTMHNASPYVRE